MRCVHLFFVALIVFIASALGSLAFESVETDSTPIIIEEGSGSGDHVNTLRMPRRIPVQAEYDSDLSAIFVVYSSDIGEVYVEVRSLSSGELLSGYCDTSCGSQLICVSGSSGVYVVTFTLESGVIFQGEFEI